MTRSQIHAAKKELEAALEEVRGLSYECDMSMSDAVNVVLRDVRRQLERHIATLETRK